MILFEETKLRVSDDYAVLITPKFKYYYGYEEQELVSEDGDYDWCFVVYKRFEDKPDEEQYRYVKSQLVLRCPYLKDIEDEPYLFLLAGMSIFSDKFLEG